MKAKLKWNTYSIEVPDLLGLYVLRIDMPRFLVVVHSVASLADHDLGHLPITRLFSTLSHAHYSIALEAAQHATY